MTGLYSLLPHEIAIIETITEGGEKMDKDQKMQGMDASAENKAEARATRKADQDNMESLSDLVMELDARARKLQDDNHSTAAQKTRTVAGMIEGVRDQFRKEYAQADESAAKAKA